MRKTKVLEYDFIGAALGPEWSVADTSAAGAPTKAMNADGYKMQFASDVEAENLCLYFGDILSLLWKNVRSITFRVKLLGATKDTTTTFAMGLGSARADNTDSITNNAMLKIVNASTTLGLVAESDDGTTDTDDKDCAAVVTNAFRDFKIDFNTGLRDVRFFVDGQPVCQAQTFDISAIAATDACQPFVQIQKTSDSNTDGVIVRKITIEVNED